MDKMRHTLRKRDKYKVSLFFLFRRFSSMRAHLRGRTRWGIKIAEYR